MQCFSLTVARRKWGDFGSSFVPHFVELAEEMLPGGQ
jgi:hypothetical protein